MKDKLVQQAFETMEMANWRPEEYDAYIRARLLMESDELDSKERFEKGLEQGKAEGEAMGIEKTALNLLDLGMEISFVVKATGLSLERIKQLGANDPS